MCELREYRGDVFAIIDLTSTDDLVESVSSLKIAAQMLVSLFDSAPCV